MTEQELKVTYSKLSTSELLEIIDNKFDYTELAVTIALQELATRKVSEEEIKNYKDEQIQSAIRFVNKNITDDLSLLQKIFFYFIWVPLFNFAFKQNFRDDGSILKLKQANYYSFIGFILFVLTAIVSVAYDFSNLNAFIIWFLGFLLAYAFDEKFNRENQIRKLKRHIESKRGDLNNQLQEEDERMDS